MEFRDYVRAHLPPLASAREPEIIDELAQHLSDLYREARAERDSEATPPSSHQSRISAFEV